MMVDGDDATTRRRKPRLSVRSGEDPSTCSVHEVKPRLMKKRRSRRDELDPPFYILVMQVGSTLFILCMISYVLYRRFVPQTLTQTGTNDDEQLYINPQEISEGAKTLPAAPTPAPTKPTPPPLPVWDLGDASRYDAYAIAERHIASLKSRRDAEVNSNKAFWNSTASIRSQFSDRYGGENAARAILERSLTTFYNGTKNSFPTGLVATACRIRQAKREVRPFKFTFGGYSVTVGRGNHFSQSFPFVMQRILETPFQAMGIDLVVKNAAIGGCPSFPYGFCKKNHWGDDSDVVSWDFSMNEAGGVAEGLEAYLRHTMTLKHRPKLIVKDTQMADMRRELLKKYVASGAIQDPLVLHSDLGVRPFLARPEEFRPTGFQKWRKFGSPPGAPGQALHHPAVKEHELIGWILAMHFLAALELIAAADGEVANHTFQIQCPSTEELREQQFTRNLLPPPMSVDITTMQEWSSPFFGVPTSSDRIIALPDKENNQNWKMNPVHCRTTYDPIVDAAGSLTSIVVSGSTGENIDVMLPKGHMFYNQAWVLDLSEGEKDAKRKLDRFGGLGFVDTKKAYRGLFTSGTLRLLLPYYSDTAKIDREEQLPQNGDMARNWFQNVIVCEVNERREPSACQIGKDITFKVGGINATKITMSDMPGTLFLGKKICAFVHVPEDAKLTIRETMLLDNTELPNGDLKKKQAQRSLDAGNITIGLSLELSINNHRIIARERACSVSHVVWEQRKPSDPRFPLVTAPPKGNISMKSASTKTTLKDTTSTVEHHDPPAIKITNVGGELNAKPLKDYVKGVP